MSVVESIVDVEKLSEWIGLQTKSSKECLLKQLNNWTYDSKKLSQLSKRVNRWMSSYIIFSFLLHYQVSLKIIV